MGNNMNGKFYLTKEGLKKLKEEYEALKELWKKKTSKEIPEILHSEDLNPEYLVFLEDLNLLEARLRELDETLKNAKLIKPPPKEKQNTIQLGATVTVEDEKGQINKFTVVGSVEADPLQGKISIDSPVGKALLGKKVGERVVISFPIKAVYKIKNIKYSIS
jgi:transcription elongation factor GreA